MGPSERLYVRVRSRSSPAVQSTAIDAPLNATQLTLYPLLTIVLPYVYKKGKMYMSDLGFSHAPADSDEFVVWSVMEQAQRAWNMVSLVNFGLFLWNGKCVAKRQSMH